MTHDRSFERTRSALAALCVLFGSSLFLGAQEPAAEDTLREKTVYVPYDKLTEVFEREGRGIFLPYHEFLELWDRARKEPPPPPPAPPPAEAVISGGLYRGEVRGGVASLDVEYRIVALKEKAWSTLALPLRNAAVEEATITPVAAGEGAEGGPDAAAEAPPPLLDGAGGAYSVHLPAPGVYDLAMKVAVRVEERPGRRSIAFGIPPAAISRLDLVIPESDARVEVQPMMAATRIEEREGATRVLAFVGNATDVTVAWSPPAGEIRREDALVTARQRIRAHLGERVLRVATEIDVDVLRQEIDRVRVRLPADMQLFSVEGENIREQEMVEGEGGDSDLLEVRLHSPVTKSYSLRLSFERILGETPERIEVPFPRVEGALRESGTLALGHDTGLRARVSELEGLSQQDVTELPEAMRAGAAFGFRYLAHPLRLALEIERILPVVHAESASAVVLGVEEDVWIGWIDYRITRAGVFSLSFEVPERWRVGSVADEATMEDYRVAPAEGRPGFSVVTVNLRNRAIGAFRLPFRLAATGTASAGEKTIQAPRALGVESDRGLLGIGGPRAFRITTGERANTVAADTRELFRTGLRGQVPQDAELDLAFTFHDHPATVTVTLEERRTEIRVNARVLVNVTDNEVQVTRDLEYLVQYAATEVLSFTAPSTLDDQLEVDAQGLRDVKRTALGDGRTRWDVTLQSRVLGVRTVTVTQRAERLDLRTGEPFTWNLPLVRAEGAEVVVEQGTVAVRKEGRLEVRETADGLQSVSKEELPPELARGSIQSAWQATRPDYALALELVRHDYVKVPDAVVPLLLARSHLSRERILDTDVVLVLENLSIQYLDMRFPEGARNVRFFVAGRERSHQRAPRREGAEPSETDLRLPLPERGAQLIRVRYQVELPGGELGAMGGIDVVLPVVVEGEGSRVPVEKVELELHLPRELVWFPGGGTLYTVGRATVDGWTWLGLGPFSNEVVRVAQAQGRSAYNGVALPPPPPEFLRENPEIHRLQTYRPEGTVGFGFLGERVYTLINLAIFALFVAAGVFAARRWRGERWWILGGGTAVLLLFAWLVSAPVAVFWLSAYRAGIVLIVGFALAAALPVTRERWSRWRAERLALAPDPFIEDAEAPSAGETSDSDENGGDKKRAKRRGKKEK